MSTAGQQTKKPDLGLLEEDDEFEEFPAESRYSAVFYLRDIEQLFSYQVINHY